jgi:hypothetical protein
VSSLPTPTVRPGAPAYPGALGALTAGGDVVLLDADTGRSIRTLVAHEPGVPVQDISWDAPRGIMYFDQLDGTCSTVWRYRLDFGRPERFAAGAQPVVSPDGTRVAVRGTGCGPGGAIADGLAIYAAATGQPIAWTPAPSSDTEPYRVVDFDWRPDPDGGSTALAVTLSGSGRYAYKFVDLALPAADLGAAADIPIVHNFRERFFELEYAGPQLFLAGHCCDGEIVQPTDRIVVRNVQSGVLTTLSQLAASSLTANRDGQVRYIEARPDSAGPIHTLTVRVGGGVVSPIDRVVTKESFLRIDWSARGRPPHRPCHSSTTAGCSRVRRRRRSTTRACPRGVPRCSPTAY